MVPLHALLKQNTRYHGSTNSIVVVLLQKMQSKQSEQKESRSQSGPLDVKQTVGIWHGAGATQGLLQQGGQSNESGARSPSVPVTLPAR